MKLARKIGFIGGGLMAEALIKGILDAGLVDSGQVLVVDPDQSRRDLLKDRFAVKVHESGDLVWSECAIIILAVKPQVVGSLLESVKDRVNSSHLIVSIAAGIPLVFMESKLSGTNCRIIRVMPNTPALVLEGASAYSPGQGVDAEDLETARMILDSVGKSVQVDEKDLDAVTGLSGSGPAYVFSFIEALIDAGVRVGLDRQTATTLVQQTVLGSVKLAMESNEHPAQLRAMVTSPGGTTIAGLHEMERAGFEGIIMDAVQAATRRSSELGD
ncbi:MAG: pyrroline-5-carboxylate reductase [Desulfobulbaceae bacterium]|nr:pyrroline-5-carboxylate reductase [Desulfobulbaceae bacterium]